MFRRLHRFTVPSFARCDGGPVLGPPPEYVSSIRRFEYHAAWGEVDLSNHLRGRGGTGRRIGLKIRWEQSRAGSTPAVPTNKNNNLDEGLDKDDFIHRHACPHEVQYHLNRPAHVSNTRLTVADLHVQGDATQLCHGMTPTVDIFWMLLSSAHGVQSKSRMCEAFGYADLSSAYEANAVAITPVAVVSKGYASLIEVPRAVEGWRWASQ